MKSVQSINPIKSVIQTIDDIVKAHGGELKVETLSAEGAAQAGNATGGASFIIYLPVIN